jgi:hypothetical protein
MEYQIEDADREAIETELYHYNINGKGGFCLSKSWKPLIGSLKTFGTWPRYIWQCGSIFLSLFVNNPTPTPSIEAWNIAL